MYRCLCVCVPNPNPNPNFYLFPAAFTQKPSHVLPTSADSAGTGTGAAGSTRHGRGTEEPLEATYGVGVILFTSGKLK